MDQLIAIDFEHAAIDAASAAFLRMAFAGCYFRPGQSVYRNLDQRGIHGKHVRDPDYKIRARTPSAIAFPPVGGAVAGFEMVGPLFENDEHGLIAYFARTYVGRRVGAGRMPPLLGIDLRNVRNRTGAVVLWANNAVGAFRNGFPSGSLRGAARRFGHLSRAPDLDKTSQIKTSSLSIRGRRTYQIRSRKPGTTSGRSWVDIWRIGAPPPPQRCWA